MDLPTSTAPAMLARQIRDDGITYNVHGPGGGGERRGRSTAALVIGADEWTLIEQGVAAARAAAQRP